MTIMTDERVHGSDRVLAPEADTSPRLFDMAQREVFTNGDDLRSDTYAAWRASDVTRLVDPLYGAEAGEYRILAKRVERTERTDVPDIAGLFERWAPGLSLALAAGTAVPMRWAGVAYFAPAGKGRSFRIGASSVLHPLLTDPSVQTTCDVWVRADDRAGRGDRDDPTYSNVCYRPLLMNTSRYGRRAVWFDPTATAGPLVVRADAGDRGVALVMPVARRDSTVHVTWAES
jgi:hypothetical protein